MRFSLPICLWVLTFLSHADAQPPTYEELLKENQELKAQLRKMLDHKEHAQTLDDDHQHENAQNHGQKNHDYEQEEYDRFHPYQSHAHDGSHKTKCTYWTKDLHGDFGSSSDGRHHNDDSPNHHGHARHGSAFGYPYVHGLRTEIDFIERALEMSMNWAKNADNGAVDEWEFEAELIWAINNRINLIFGMPLVSLFPDNGSTDTGIGDLEVGFRFQAWNGKHWLVFFGLDALLPTGNEGRELGSGHVTLEPVFLQLYDFGCGTYVQNVLRWSLPIDVEEPDNVFSYDFGVYHTLVETRNLPFFRYLTPLLEVNGVTALNGPESGRTSIDLTPGIRWFVREQDDMGVGVSFPVTGHREFDYQILFQYLLHF